MQPKQEQVFLLFTKKEVNMEQWENIWWADKRKEKMQNLKFVVKYCDNEKSSAFYQ